MDEILLMAAMFWASDDNTEVDYPHKDVHALENDWGIWDFKSPMIFRWTTRANFCLLIREAIKD